MSNVSDLHNKAMELAERAIIARVQHDSVIAIELFRAAMESELSAIEELDEKVEPTYSILHRSAATLALDCNEVSKAREIVNQALRSETPPEIAIELRDVLRQVDERSVPDENMTMLKLTYQSIMSHVEKADKVIPICSLRSDLLFAR